MRPVGRRRPCTASVAGQSPGASVGQQSDLVDDDALFVSKRTVESHLGSLYRKLSVSTRVALALAAPAITVDSVER